MFLKSLFIAATLMSGLQFAGNNVNYHEKTVCRGSQTTVYVTRTGTKFHRGNCYHIDGRMTFSMSRSSAVNRGYQACKHCRP